MNYLEIIDTNKRALKDMGNENLGVMYVPLTEENTTLGVLVLVRGEYLEDFEKDFRNWQDKGKK